MHQRVRVCNMGSQRRVDHFYGHRLPVCRTERRVRLAAVHFVQHPVQWRMVPGPLRRVAERAPIAFGLATRRRVVSWRPPWNNGAALPLEITHRFGSDFVPAEIMLGLLGCLGQRKDAGTERSQAAGRTTERAPGRQSRQQ